MNRRTFARRSLTAVLGVAAAVAVAPAVSTAAPVVPEPIIPEPVGLLPLPPGAGDVQKLLDLFQQRIDAQTPSVSAFGGQVGSYSGVGPLYATSGFVPQRLAVGSHTHEMAPHTMSSLSSTGGPDHQHTHGGSTFSGSTVDVAGSNHHHPTGPDGMPGTASRAPFATWETRQELDGSWYIADSFTGERFTGPPTWEMLYALEEPSFWRRDSAYGGHRVQGA